MPAATAVVTPKATEVRLDLESKPLRPLHGTVKSYRISEASQLVAGLYGDAFIGDYALENDLIKAVVARPEKKVIDAASGGHLIDLVQLNNPVDYLNYIRTVGDLETTTSQIIYDMADEPAVEGGTTATVVMHGYLARRVEGDESTAPLRRMEGVDVTTTYALPKDREFLVVTTRIENKTSEPLSLLPGDVIDWGMAASFLEGAGVPSTGMDASVTWMAGGMDDFSAGIVTSDTLTVSGSSSLRYSLVRGYGSGPLNLPLSLPPGAAKISDPPSKPEPMDTEMPMRPTPVPRTETGFRPAIPAPARPETSYAPAGVLAPPRVPPVPRVETMYTPPNVTAPPGVETSHAPRPVSRVPDDATPDLTGPGPLPRYAKGGGESDTPETTVPKQAASAALGAAAPSAPGRLSLAPGQAYEFTRYVVVSDRDYARISNFAYEAKGIPTGVVAGAVLEQGTDKPVAGAEIRVLGGPKWDGMSQPRPFTRTITRADGTFVLHMPRGRYVRDFP